MVQGLFCGRVRRSSWVIEAGGCKGSVDRLQGEWVTGGGLEGGGTIVGSECVMAEWTCSGVFGFSISSNGEDEGERGSAGEKYWLGGWTVSGGGCNGLSTERDFAAGDGLKDGEGEGLGDLPGVEVRGAPGGGDDLLVGCGEASVSRSMKEDFAPFFCW
ncbi:hypothetical protein L6452_08841 [Arctium lappa]|uniref:Uncharacterized protein n=1 Tax=Arctium lappa TaxID=4217 RepID=A0ACB9DIB4_ARCLA|nr:hypothetical protein L6452_08841 [Arctium lappa]